MNFKITVTIDAPDWATADNARHEMACRAADLIESGSVVCANIHFGEVSGSDDSVDQMYRDLAHDQYHKDGEIEIDDDAAVSIGDDPGAYVQAWVWVDAPTQPEPAEEPVESEGGHCD